MATPREIDELFDRAVELDADARARFVRERAGHDLELAERVLELLAAADGASPLDRPLASVADGLLEAIESSRLGRGDLEGERLGSYQLERLHAEGGMAEVYEASRVDGAFDRRVAVKVLRHGLRSARGRERFERERQILAGLSNRHVAALHDGGLTADGRPYVVLEWINGTPLTEHCREHDLPLAERLRLVVQACEGVRHAHRHGILHRDLKPSNLLVERRSDTGDRVVVCDFGIAKTEDEAGLTMTGQTLGTPGYMSPEQARGDAAAAAPTADVFSLGAVLFELVCGRALYPGRSASEVLGRALEGRIEPPRGLAPGLPRDLETVLLVALDPRPAMRYQNVAALASDLEAVLAGEPVSVRRPSLADRAWRRARKHPRSAAGATAALLAVCVLAGLVLRTRLEAGRRAESARRFGQLVERVDQQLRIAHSLPAHDIRPDHERVRAQLAGIRKEISSDPANLGPGSYALGRGALALGELDAAREHLERALAAGFRPPELALTLGRVLAEIYQRDLPAAKRIGDPAERDAAVARLERELRDPAIAFLREGQASAVDAGAGSQAYVNGLVAFQEEAYEESRRLAAEARAAVPWLHEADVLASRAHAAEGDLDYNAGRYDAAAADYEAALAALDRALEVGRSDPDVHLKKCTTSNRILQLRRENGSLDAATFVETARICGAGLAVDPGSYGLLWSLARVHWQEQSFLRNAGEDPMPAIRRMIESAERAIAVRPDQPQAQNLLGLGWLARAQIDLAEGRDPGEALERAERTYLRTLEIDPDHRHARNNLGLVEYLRAKRADRSGDDPRPAARRAIEWYEATVERDSDYLFAHSNAAVSWRILARDAMRRGEDPLPALAEGVAAARRALALNPNFSNALEHLGIVLTDRARYRIASGVGSPEDDLAGAGEALGRAVEVNTTYWSHHRQLAELRRLEAEWARRKGRDPAGLLRRAEAALDEAQRLNPEAVDVRLTRVLVALERAAAAPEGPRPHLVEADRWLDELRRDRPDDRQVAELEERRRDFGDG